MEFKKVADAFSAIEQTSGRLEITKLLAELLTQLSPAEAEIICHMAMGQLNPPHIGTQFNMAQKAVIKAVAQMLDRSQEWVEAENKKIGDLGLIIAMGDWRASDTLSIADVYQALHAIEKMSGTGSQEQKVDQLIVLLKQLDCQSAKYVVRIIIGKLRLGFSDMTIIDALSWMQSGDKSLRAVIEDAYNVCADIGHIALLLKRDGIAAIEAAQIEVGIPIRPAAAERLPTAKAIVEKLGDCVAQPKLDGFRLQIHLDKRSADPKVHFYSRHLQDMSAMFPDLKKVVAELKVDTMICEGEAIGYDPNTNVFLPFQETVKRKRKHGIDEAAQEFPLKVYLFDILYLNGKNLLAQTHTHRRDILETIFEKKHSDVVQLVDERAIKDARHLQDYFNENIQAGLEGLVVKRTDAIYQPGKRNFNWIKLKREDEGQLEDSVDCVILGYYAGAGKRAAFGIGAFLVGVFNEKEDCFETVAKIGTGVKDAGWVELKKRCDAIAVQAKPRNVVCAKELTPDVWVLPEIVVEVLADEITLSPVHTAAKTEDNLGYALRFPRFVKYRDDKGPLEATTNQEMKRLFHDQFGR